MWTTSSSRASLLAALVCGAVHAPLAAQPRTPQPMPPEAPMPALPQEPRPAIPDRSVRPEPVEIRSVSVRRLAQDSALVRLAGRPFLESAREPLVIEVRTARPLGRLDRTGSPEIYLNGERIGDTWALGEDRLVAFLPDRRRLRELNEVTVAWLGTEELTRTRAPATFGARQVQ